MAMSSLSAQLAGISGQTLPTSRRKEDAIGRGIAHSTQLGYSVHAPSSKYKPSVLYEDARAASDVPLTTLRENAVSALNQLARLTGSDAFVSKDYVGLLAGKTSITWERRVSQKSDVVQRDKLCEKLLGLLGTVWGDDENSAVINSAESVSELALGVTAFASGLHVLEYMLRLYSIHLHLPQDLLLSVLSAHETPLFNRVLQLIDLAEMPSFIFLRPFAAPGAETLPRGSISKRAAADDALVASLCKLARDVARIHSDEVAATSAGGGAASTTGPVQPRRGISRVISFVAAVLIEALDIQTTAVTSAGSAKETTLRILLPYVLGACCGADNKNEKAGRAFLSVICSDYRSLGYILASALVAKCPAMTSDVREVMATTIAKGAVEMATALGYGAKGQDPEGGETNDATDSASMEAIEELTTSILALLSVLSMQSSSEENNKQAATLVRVSSSTGKSKKEADIGISMPASTFRQLVKLAHLTPAALGEILDSQGIDVTNLVASLYVRSFDLMLPPANTKEKIGKIAARRKEALQLVLGMIKEPSLQDIWTKQSGELTATVSSNLVSSFATVSGEVEEALGDGNDDYFLVTCQSVLEALRSVSAASCDAGVAHAVASLKRGKKKKKRQHAARRLELLFGQQSPAAANHGLEASSEHVSGDGASAVDDEFVRLLPARVALEHPDASIRQTAVKRLLDECEMAASTDPGAVGEAVSNTLNRDGAVVLCRSLLRRFVADDDSGVAAAAAATIRRLVAEGIVCEEDVFADADSIHKAISGLLKWSVLDDIPSKCSELDSTEEGAEEEKPENSELSNRLDVPPPADPVEAMCCALALAGLAASTLLSIIDDEDVYSPQIESEGELLRILLLYIGAHLDITSDVLGEEDCRAACELIYDAAASALIHAVTKDEESDSASDIQEIALKLLCGDENCIAVLLCTCSGETSEEAEGVNKNMERRYMWACLTTMVGGLGGAGDDDDRSSDEDDIGNDMLAQNVLSIIHHILAMFGDAKAQRVSEREASALLRHLVACFAYIINHVAATLPAALIDLCSVSSLAAYDKVSKPAILLLFGATDKTAESSLSPVAILLEAASRHGVHELAATRLITLAIHCMTDQTILSPKDNVVNGLVHAISLLSHSSRAVRESAVEFISKMSSLKIKKLPKLCVRACDAISSFKPSLMMDGSGTLPNFLADIVVKSDSPDETRKSLFTHCVVAAIGTSATVEEGFSFGDYLGGAFAVCTVLGAIKETGEETFPLTEQWNQAGRPLFAAFLSPDVDTYWYSDRFADMDMHAVKVLCESIVVMLKGVVTSKDQEPSVVISTGPARSGRRARSYSVGTGDGVSFIEPYPDDMSKALSTLLSTSSERIEEPYIRLAYETSTRLVLKSQTWGERVFPKFAVKVRREIVSALLVLRSQHGVESAGAALGTLHIDASDLCFLLKSDSATDPLALTCVADTVRNRAAFLAGIDVAFDLSSLLFEKLAYLSTGLSVVGGYDYTRLSLLQALVSLHKEMVSQNVLPPHKKKKDTSSSRKKGGRSRSQSDAAVERFAEQATLLVALISGKDTKLGASEILPIHSNRGKTLVLSLLTVLCSQAPGSVVGSLLPALGQFIAPSSSNEISTSADQALRAIVPAYCEHATASVLTFVDLIDAFTTSCNLEGAQPQQRAMLCTSFADALITVSMARGHGEAMASFVASLVAADAARTVQSTGDDSGESMDVDQPEVEMSEEDPQDPVSLSVHIVGRASTTDQVVASLQIVRYVGEMIELLSKTMGSSMATDSTEASPSKVGGGLSYAVSVHHLCDLAAGRGDLEENKKQALVLLTTNLLSIVRDMFSYSSIKKIIKNNEGTALNNVCLSLWQELVQLQSNSLRCQAIAFSRTKTGVESSGKLSRDEKEFWESTPAAAEECLDLLQRVLPVPDYLASVTNLLQDDDTEAPLFVRTAELLSERASEIDPYSHEATLFLEVVPELVTILTRSSEGDDTEEAGGGPRYQVMIKQASLMAIERLAHALCLVTGDEKVFKKGASVLFPAIKEVIALLTGLSNNLVGGIEGSSSDEVVLNDAEIQLLSTAALCASTLVAVLRARCVPLLSKLVKPIISSLSCTNACLRKSLDSSDQTKYHKSAKLSQLALLRTLVSVAETLPQFAVPYLGLLFAPSALPARTLRQDESEDDTLVANMTERLDRALAKRTPARQLIPIASKAITKFLNSNKADAAGWQEARALLTILKSSIECTASAELTPVVGKLLNALLLAYTYDESEEGQQELLSAANVALLALVMKLSEAQLRPLYARIREWRGDLEAKEEDIRAASTKRYAFWSMSSLLSKELRSIFLPCLSSVLVDAIKELEFASTMLCGADFFYSKKAGGKKRRRLGSGDDVFSLKSLKPLQSVLLCLESALKADAHEGGNWIRGEDGQRHTLILEPLGKLLQAKVPADLPIVTSLGEKESASTSSFQQLVEGMGTLDYGSVAKCIVALAMAAGDEQMWKPINHTLLDACRNDDRAEVRKVGVGCLKSVMESIGEEYMVLLPECLPTLSELLEDEDEEIAGLARECVTLGEELLGESLEDSLR